jgi:hypothetical protein
MDRFDKSAIGLARHAENAIDVAIGGKADIPYCGANVCF